MEVHYGTDSNYYHRLFLWRKRVNVLEPLTLSVRTSLAVPRSPAPHDLAFPLLISSDTATYRRGTETDASKQVPESHSHLEHTTDC